MSLPQMYSLDEVKDALGLSRQKVTQLIRSGDLPAVKVGQQYRIRAEHVEQLLAATQVQPIRPGVRAVI